MNHFSQARLADCYLTFITAQVSISYQNLIIPLYRRRATVLATYHCIGDTFFACTSSKILPNSKLARVPNFIMASINAKPSLKIETTPSMPPPSTTSATPATENPRPILKLNTAARNSSFSEGATPTASAAKRIKIKIGSTPSTPAVTNGGLQTPSITKTKAGRTPKPTAKLAESKKRTYDDSDEDRPMAASRIESGRPPKMIKILPSKSTPNTPGGVTTPITNIKFKKKKGEAIRHQPGEAYDSEASDREDDPVRESAFILRVMSEEPASYLRSAIEQSTIGAGADFGVVFLDAKERRAMVNIANRNYAAVLVKLPTVTEAMKTWDRKTMLKNCDMTEMLWCFAEVRNENEARTIPLPNMVQNNDYRWPHGITPPMHDAANRRFRKTISEKEWQSAADKVKKLLDDDASAISSRYEVLNDDDADMEDDYDEDADADGDLDADLGDYFGPQGDQDMDIDDGDGDSDVAAMEAELAQEEEAERSAATPITQLEAPTPMTIEGNTPGPTQEDPPPGEEEEEEEEISEEDEDDESDDDDEDDEEKNDAELAADRERKELRASLNELKAQLALKQQEYDNSNTPFIKNRLVKNIANIKKEIAVKRAALGLDDEE
ncbi:hypothetical protein F4778DRAFT_716172 [Xylariomycetidae sp. FL2044]|nr:hypothetical protein F4778DRAFT_716172 [Xylariomycetidae sp. FL2044]